MSEAVHGSEKKGWIGEDWLSLILGLVIFTISLVSCHTSNVG